MENEIWKDVVGYEGLYQVSNLGRVRSVDRIVNGRWGNNFVKGLILKPYTVKGYKQVHLSKNNKKTHYKIHRLVAETFIPNPYKLPQVNHKDEDKTNNCVENLEFCTQSYNNNYGTRLKRISEKNKISMKGKFNNSRSKSVLQYTLDGNFVKEYPSAREAERINNIDFSAISKCCRGVYKSAGGYIWKFKEKSES